ncbi:MAG TPA: hypothetical protein VMU33_09645 [Burkholderiaceae bacterium]|nr:hypothetical protein [Burkholderiaceae bacterium]
MNPRPLALNDLPARPRLALTHGAVQAALMVIAALSGCAAGNGASATRASGDDDVRTLQARVVQLEERVERDEYALIAVSRRVRDPSRATDASAAPLTTSTVTSPRAGAPAAAVVSAPQKAVLDARERVAAADRESRHAGAGVAGPKQGDEAPRWGAAGTATMASETAGAGESPRDTPWAPGTWR